MSDLLTSLFSSIVSIFVLIMIGLGLRRLGLVGLKGADLVSRWVIYFFFPVLVFHRLAITDHPDSIITEYMIHVWAVIMLVGSGIIGWCWHRLVRTKAHLRTFIFSVGFPNWIYLPLAIAGPLWGDEAVRLLILFNIPTQIILWTGGIWVLHGTLRGAHVIKYMLLNPGLISAVLGLLVAFNIIPVTFAADGKGLSLSALNPLFHLIGGITVPLSIIALGLYLGERTPPRVGAKREVLMATIGRLVVAPLLIGGLLLLATHLGLNTPIKTRWILYLIMSMPVAVSAPLFAQMFQGDRYLASRAVVYSTLAGLFTSPLFMLAALRLEIWLGLADSLSFNQ